MEVERCWEAGEAIRPLLVIVSGVLARNILAENSAFSKGPIMRLETPPEHKEGKIAEAIEQQTAKLPSDTFLWLAGASIVGSLVLKMTGRQHTALFVGQWAPTFLILGLYNKLVKVAGSD